MPIAVGGDGNMTAYFEVLSYPGTITVTAITDPDHFPDAGGLADARHAELDQIMASGQWLEWGRTTRQLPGCSP